MTAPVPAGLPGPALVRLTSAHSAVIAWRLRLGMAQRRVERETTDAAWAELDDAATHATAAEQELRAAWLAYGFAVQAITHVGQLGSTASNN